MAAFLFFAYDGGDKSALRTKHLIEHLSFAESMYKNIMIGGPVFPLESKQMDRSLIMLEAPDADTARSMFESDPYFKNKIWDRYEMMAFSPVIGTLLGGKTWEIVDGKVVRKELPQK
jgi:uncharacterized protein YciI